jgi:cysteinyl-tRNA synthetase
VLAIYNSLGRAKQPFVAIVPGHVGLYVCGMTVYDDCHIGHARVMVAFDVIVRWLRAAGFVVNYVRNITDVDDKIIHRAAEKGEPISVLTEHYIARMHADAAALGVLPPDAEPRATHYVPQMVALIQTLLNRGLAYLADNGDVYYSVRDFPAYGKLSGKSLDDLRAGERVEVDAHKRDALDFVLWKAAKAGDPAWDAPWGSGRPGWHIECSAMSEALLSPHFDLHGGGQDLQFPHHENEIAQSEGAHGCVMANYWMHNGFVRVDNEKMSKSLGNFFTIREVFSRFDAETVRFFIARTHYRSPLNYADVHLDDARQSLNRLYIALRDVPPAPLAQVDWQQPEAAQFKTAMDDDFNTPLAMAVLFDLATQVHKKRDAALSGLLKALAGVLGFLQQDPQQHLQQLTGCPLQESDIMAHIAQRQEARLAKDYATADAVRQQLLAAGIVLEDSAQGTTWRRS